MFAILAFAQAACVGPEPPKRAAVDTSRFEYVDGTRTLRQHGDTVWSIVGDRKMRIIDDGRRISIQRIENGVSSQTVFCVNGTLAVPLNAPKGAASVPVSLLRVVRDVVESARAGDAILRKLRSP